MPERVGSLEGKQARRGLEAVGEGHGPRKLGLAALHETSSRDRGAPRPCRGGWAWGKEAGRVELSGPDRTRFNWQALARATGRTPFPVDLSGRPLAPGPAHRVPDLQTCQRWAGQPGTRPGHSSLHLSGLGQGPLCTADWPGVEMGGTAGLETSSRKIKCKSKHSSSGRGRADGRAARIDTQSGSPKPTWAL